MGGDYSKSNFDFSKNYTRVLMQQGRVNLDSDWNEHAEITDRRLRMKALDLMGPVSVSQATPEGFKVVFKEEQLYIHPGRIYLNGHLAENLQSECSYSEQPYWFDSTLPSDYPYVVYLDVWEREVTSTEDSSLIEKAVGVDTTTRIQTVWQVKTTPRVVDFTTVGIPLEELEYASPDQEKPHFGPSTARLSTITDSSLTPEGLENCLYRVQIHEITQEDILIKWSRDNASITAPVKGISEDRLTLTLKSIGQKKVLPFEKGDWIEVLNEKLALEEKTVELVQIKNVEPENQKITLEDRVKDPEKGSQVHIRLWNGKEQVAIPPAGPAKFDLEKGIKLKLSGEPRLGDYWTFFARTVDGSIEQLEEAPPLGNRHHYCMLALVKSPTEVSDARFFMRPTAKSCTTIVYPGDSIQAALDQLPPEGGHICLKTGEHHLSGHLIINKSNVILRGESPGTRVIRDNGGEIFKASSINNVKIEEISFEANSENASEGDLVHIDSCQDFTLQHCSLIHAKTQGNGIYINNSSVTISKNKITSVTNNDRELESYGISIEESEDILIEMNQIKGHQNGIFALKSTAHIKENTLKGLINALDLEGGTDNHIIGNQITNSKRGIKCINETRAVFKDNAVSDLNEYGLLALEFIDSILINRNDFLNCCKKPLSYADDDPAAVVDLKQSDGKAIVTSCRIFSSSSGEYDGIFIRDVHLSDIQSNEVEILHEDQQCLVLQYKKEPYNQSAFILNNRFENRGTGRTLVTTTNLKFLNFSLNYCYHKVRTEKTMPILEPGPRPEPRPRLVTIPTYSVYFKNMKSAACIRGNYIWWDNFQNDDHWGLLKGISAKDAGNVTPVGELLEEPEDSS